MPQVRMHCDSAAQVFDAAGGHMEYRFSAPPPADTATSAAWGSVVLEVRGGSRLGTPQYTPGLWYPFDFPATPS